MVSVLSYKLSVKLKHVGKKHNKKNANSITATVRGVFMKITIDTLHNRFGERSLFSPVLALIQPDRSDSYASLTQNKTRIEAYLKLSGKLGACSYRFLVRRMGVNKTNANVCINALI